MFIKICWFQKLKCVALKRLQSELEITNNETVEESDEVLSSTKTTTPSLKKSPKSSDFGMNVIFVFWPHYI